MRREFLQLAHPYEGQDVSGWFWSVKLDGQRAFWDGGVSRGMETSEVPWANTAADGRYVERPKATGLWSRYGKTIQAPDWWIEQLPPVPLDMELYAGRGGFQRLRSIVARLTPGEEWRGVEARVLDLPSWQQVMATGHIKAPSAHWDLKLSWDVASKWLASRGQSVFGHKLPFTDVVDLMRLMESNDVVCIHPQQRLPLDRDEAAKKVEEESRREVSLGGEGLVVRNPFRVWEPKRVSSVLKVKPSSDAEGTVVGFTWGRRTERGSRHLGRMGALILRIASGARLELSGFTDAERAVKPLEGADPAEPVYREGKDASDKWECIEFPLGTVVTYTYRELTDAGLPKEARFLRTRTPE